MLEAIQARPATRAADLAAEFGLEKQPFKQRVVKLKNLGLTISLPTGYQLSPRGAAYLRHRIGGGGRESSKNPGKNSPAGDHTPRRIG